MASKKSSTLFDAGLTWAERQAKNLSPLASRLRTPLAAKLTIGAAFLVYFVAQFYLSVGPTLVRQTPVEADDAYSYIVKAAAMQAGCFSEGCSAMSSLREQLQNPTDNPEAASIRHREYHRIFYFYHPIHSFALAGLNSAGLTWEHAYDVVWLAGKILIIFAVAYFMLSVWGPSTASLALILLSVTVLQGQGLHAVVPSNLALALALILWAEIYMKSKRLAWVMPVLIILMLLMHPIGRLYGFLILVFALLDTQWPLHRKEAMTIGVSLLLVAIYFILPSLIPSIELAFNPGDFYPGSWDYIGALQESLSVTIRVVTNWAAHWGGFVFVVPFVLLGIICYRQDQKRLILILGLSLAFAAASFFYVVPFYGALGFERAWIVLAILLVGAISQGFVTLAGIVGSELKIKGSIIAKDRKWRVGFALVLGLFLLASAARYLASQSRNYSSTYDSMAHSGESLFNPAQPAMTGGPGRSQTILYMEELSLYYYLSHGALNSQAVYYPAVAGTPDEAKWVLDQTNEFDFIVARNPIYRLPHTPDGFIKLNLQESLTINSTAPFDTETLQIFVGPRSGPVIFTLTLVSGENREDLRVVIPEGNPGWVTLIDEQMRADRIVLRIRQSSQSIEIGGLRFDNSGSNLWPWDQGKSLIFRAADEAETEITFNSNDLIKQLPFHVEIIDDEGASVLARVVEIGDD
jgi:hypothetical protein